MTVANWTNSQVINQLNSGYKWTGSTITYAFPTSASGIYYQNEGTGFRAISSSQQTLFTLALQTWDDLIPQNFQLTTLTSSNIEFGYSSSMDGYAHAYFPTNGSVWFKTGSDVASATVGSYGFATIMHELGHALGLNHMGDYDASEGDSFTPSSFQDSRVLSIMSYFGPSGGQRSSEVQWADWTATNGQDYSPQTPMLYDVLAIQTIYGTSTTTRTGDTIYGFSSNVTGSSASLYNFTINANPVLTIFDSGGTDTLNLSGWSTPSYIYLESGLFSSCDGMTNNISIAYSSIIENAVGGAGNDTLTGNSSDNRLEGGSGNDQLDGGAGNDVLIGGGGNDIIIGGSGEDTIILAGAFSSYTVSYNAVNGTYSVSGTATGTDSISGVEYFQFSDVSKAANQLQSTDTTAPTLTSMSPTDNAVSVSPGANLVLSFSESVQVGSGNIIIYNANGTVARTIAVTDSSQVSISGSNVTINPNTDLALGSSYYLNIASGIFKDLAGNSFAGISGSTAYNFTTTTTTVDTSAPTLTSLSPADNAVSVSPGTNLVLNFNETVQAGSGSFIIYNANGTIARTIAVTDSSQVTISGSTVTINPTADLAAGSNYYLNVASGVIKDLSGNSFQGISGTSAYNFTTATAASTDDYPWATNTNGVVVVNGSGTTGVIETVDDADLFKVSLIAGTTYLFDLTRTTGGLSDPYLTLYNPSANRIAYDDDSGGSSNARISYTATTSGTYYLGAMDYETGTGSYTIRAATVDTTSPTLISSTPTDNAINVLPGANLILNFNEAIQAGTGNFIIYNASGTVARTIAVTDTTQVTISGSTVTINPATDLAFSSSYYLTIASGAVKDLAGNNFAGISGSTAYNFTTAAPAVTDDYPWSSNTTGVVVVNGSATNGVVNFTDDMDLFKVTLTAGTSYVFNLASTAGGLSDPYLQLYSPTGELLSFDDDSAGALNSRISYTANSTGTYYLGAMDQGSGTGAYTLSAATVTFTDDYPWNTSTSGVVVVNGAGTSGVINVSDDADLFKVTLTAGTTYTFNLTRSTDGLSDPYLCLYSPTTDLVASDDDSGGSQNSQITYTASTSGTYYLGAMDYGSGTGRYTISATTGGNTSGAIINGTSGNDTLISHLGNDTINGGSGLDTVVYADSRSAHSITKNAADYVVNGGIYGNDTLTGIERLQFADMGLALDVGIHESAGETALLMGAVLGKASLNNKAVIGTLLQFFDAGNTMQNAAEVLVNGGIMDQLAGGSSINSYVNLIYRNVVGQEATPDTTSALASFITSGTLTKASFLAVIAELPLNQDNINLVGLAQSGLEYM